MLTGHIRHTKECGGSDPVVAWAIGFRAGEPFVLLRPAEHDRLLAEAKAEGAREALGAGWLCFTLRRNEVGTGSRFTRAGTCVTVPVENVSSISPRTDQPDGSTVVRLRDGRSLYAVESVQALVAGLQAGAPKPPACAAAPPNNLEEVADGLREMWAVIGATPGGLSSLSQYFSQGDSADPEDSKGASPVTFVNPAEITEYEDDLRERGRRIIEACEAFANTPVGRWFLAQGEPVEPFTALLELVPQGAGFTFWRVGDSCYIRRSNTGLAGSEAEEGISLDEAARKLVAVIEEAAK